MTEKILYLHGLDSCLHEDRREVLQKYGQVIAPVFDYKNEPQLFSQLCNDYKDVMAIIGSSAGGLIGYYLAQKLHKPCALFNPALSFRSQLPFSPFWDKAYKQYMLLVIGIQDDVIPYEKSLSIAAEEKTPEQTIDIHLIQNMGHLYPIEFFSRELNFFFHRIKTNI